MFSVHVPCCHCNKDFLGAIAGVVKDVYCPGCRLAVPFPNAKPGEPLWLVARDKRKMGPFTTLQLSLLAASRQLTPKDMVLLQGAGKWQEAKSVPGVFAVADAEKALKFLTPPVRLDDSDDIFGSSNTPQGPLSLKGIKVRANFSLTLGDFQILRKVGAGGMGAVYLAHQRSLNRSVALKVLSDDHAAKEAFVQRFHREIVTLASLDHPNIVKFLGAGQEKNIPFFAMEFIEGYNTAALVKHRGKLAVGDALHIALRSADALNYAHTHKIVHRDIKPENIMITRLGQIKVTDVGLAKSVEDADLDLTDTGVTLGSPKYMAPEQSRNARHADLRSDIYALGGVLYYLLTAEPPFKGASTTELLLAKEQKQFTPARRLNAEIPSRLNLMIDKLLAKDPKYRYQNYLELIADLDSLGLAHEQLSFDAAVAVPIDDVGPAYELVEILLIDNDLDDVCLVRQGLEENGIPSNLVVVHDGSEARAFLRREGKYMLAPPPNLIIFGSNLNPADSLLTLEELKLNESLSRIPLVMLANSEGTSQFFESRGYPVRVVANLPDEPSELDQFFKSAHGLCLTVMELKPKV